MRGVRRNAVPTLRTHIQDGSIHRTLSYPTGGLLCSSGHVSSPIFQIHSTLRGPNSRSLLLVRLATRSFAESISAEGRLNRERENAHIRPALTSAWHTLVKRKLDQGSVSEMWQVWQDMREEGVLPNASLYGVALDGLKKTNRNKEFFVLFEEMRDHGMMPNGVLYNMAIHVAAKQAQIEKAFDLAKDMDKAGLSKDAQTYGSLLYACSRVKDFDRALSVVAEMVKSGQQPNAYIYTELFNSCGSKEHLEQAASVLDYVITHNSDPNLRLLSAYNCFMSKCMELGCPDMGLDWYERMSGNGLTPDSRTYFSLIRGCLVAVEPQYDVAMRLFGEMKSKRISADRPSLYEFLLQQAQEPHRIEASFAVLEDMLACGHRPSAPTWSLLFSAACANNRPDIVQFVWDKMGEQGVARNLHMLRLYKQFCQRHMPERLDEAREHMSQWTPTPS